MKKSRGPAKRLAPTLAPEACCPHEFTGSEGLQLEVDCEACGGAQDLGNRRCMVGVINVIARGAVPEKIVLKRFMHKRYRNDIVSLVACAAHELSALTRATASASTPSDRRCRTCPSSPKRLMEEMRERLLGDPRAYVLDRTLVTDTLEKAIAQTGCDRRQECGVVARSASTLSPRRLP